MKLNESQIKQLTAICTWIIDYDIGGDLPNSDGSATDKIVSNAHNLTGLIVKHNINAIKNKESEKDWRDDFYEVEMYVQVEYRHKVLVKVPEGSTPVAEAKKAMELEPLKHWCNPDFLWSQDCDDLVVGEVFVSGDVLGCEEAEGYKNTPEHYEQALATAINCTTNAERKA